MTGFNNIKRNKMTPKEKAEELVNKLFKFNHRVKWNSDNNEWTHDYYQAKQCALIAVNEILSSGVDVDYYFDKSVGYMISYVEYYQEVKQEIEKK
jgi:hypothetical protein